MPGFIIIMGYIELSWSHLIRTQPWNRIILFVHFTNFLLKRGLEGFSHLSKLTDSKWWNRDLNQGSVAPKAVCFVYLYRKPADLPETWGLVLPDPDLTWQRGPATWIQERKTALQGKVDMIRYRAGQSRLVQFSLHSFSVISHFNS